MIGLLIAISLIISIILKVVYKREILEIIIALIILVAFNSLVVAIDISSQTTDNEIWSGRITEVVHKEEWDEWHKERTETYTDSKGKTHTKIIPGYWEHHYSYNKINTSDEGWINVDKTPEGRKMNDSFPNSTEELAQYWKIGAPTSSVHTYENKVQASYSIYKNENINVKDYPDLPDYPLEVRNYVYLDRILGNVPNKDKALELLNERNSELNKFIPDPENEGKKRSYKQVNMIFVNVGENKTEDYGFALQDKWENGNKNDFIISFSMNNDGKINWVYPFSWSDNESTEKLKILTRDYMLNLDVIKDFEPVVKEVSNLVEKNFERKQFAEFNYLQIEVSTGAKIFLVIINGVVLILYGLYIKSEIENHNRRQRYKRYYH